MPENEELMAVASYGGVTESSSESSPADAMPAGGDAPADIPPYIFAVGRIEPRFPSIDVEKEFIQATARAEAVNLTDRQALQSVLSDRANRYLVRQLVWVFTIEGLETYILSPRDPQDFDLFVDSLRANPRETDIDVIVGVRGPLAPPELANGLVVPLVAIEQVFSFDVDALIEGIPRPDDISAEDFAPVAEDTYHRLVQMADNAGATDEHRALNYLAVRYSAIYAEAAAKTTQQNSALASVTVQPSRLSGVRRIVDVIFTYRSRETDTSEASFVRVDVHGEFPFVVTRLSPYYAR